MSDRPLAGRTALVTGSGRNIGRAIALRLAQAGANVVVNGHRDAAAVERVAEAARGLGAGALGVMADVADPAQVAAMVVRAEDAFGGIDIAVSNVGLRLPRPFLEITLEEWRRVIDTNLSAAFYLDRAVLPGMVARGWGRVIHISGYDGFTGHIPNRAHNVAAKAGLHGLTRALAHEFGRRGITVNTIVPGAIDTERDLSVFPPAFLAALNERIAVGRWGRVEEIAEACLYLASEGGAFMTGQALHLNGGEFML